MGLPFCALVLTILGVFWIETDGNSVTLTPSPNATVNEGDTLTLRCDYNGSYTLITVNWYLNHNPFCLEVYASSCGYITTPPTYEISRYNTTCINNRFSLHITNVTKDKDDSRIWECDTTPRGSSPPTKALTTIIVTDKKTPSLQTNDDCAHKSHQDNALGVGLINIIICGICLICIVILVKSVKIHTEDELQNLKPDGSEKTITASVHGCFISSVQWIGPHGNILTSSGKYKMTYDRNTGISTLQISAFEINDSGLYSCHAKGVCGSSAQDSVRISVYDAEDPNTYATDPKQSANKLILGLGVGIMYVVCIANIMISVMIGKPCAPKLGLGIGIGLGIPFAFCIIVIVILVNKGAITPKKPCFKNPPENRKLKSGFSSLNKDGQLTRNFFVCLTCCFQSATIGIWETILSCEKKIEIIEGPHVILIADDYLLTAFKFKKTLRSCGKF